MIKFTRSDPRQNMHRFYATSRRRCSARWALVAEWGRIGSAGRLQERVFPSRELAQAALGRRQSAKLRRGYRLTGS